MLTNSVNLLTLNHNEHHVGPNYLSEHYRYTCLYLSMIGNDDISAALSQYANRWDVSHCCLSARVCIYYRVARIQIERQAR